MFNRFGSRQGDMTPFSPSSSSSSSRRDDYNLLPNELLDCGNDKLQSFRHKILSIVEATETLATLHPDPYLMRLIDQYKKMMNVPPTSGHGSASDLENLIHSVVNVTNAADLLFGESPDPYLTMLIRKIKEVILSHDATNIEGPADPLPKRTKLLYSENEVSSNSTIKSNVVLCDPGQYQRSAEPVIPEFITTESDAMIEDDADGEDIDQVTTDFIQDKVLSNPKLLQKIIERLEFVDLIRARRVGHKWNEIASNILEDSGACSVMLKYDSSKKIFRQTSWLEWFLGPDHCSMESLNRRPSLSDLNKILGNSRGFPCINYAFKNGNLADSQVQELILSQGHKIKELHLSRICKKKGSTDGTEKSAFFKLLQQVPYVEILDIHDSEYFWKKSEQIRIPSLTTVFFPECPRTAAAILRATTNNKLEEVIDPTGNQELIHVLISSKKINLVKNIYLNENTNLKRLKLFVSAKFPSPQLDQIYLYVTSKFKKFVPEKQKKFAASISQLLESSKNSLKTLSLSGLIDCAAITIPVLKKLDTLKLDWLQCPEPSPCFPGVDLSKKFPNIQKLDCGSLPYCYQDSDWDLFFPPGTLVWNLVTVKILVINDSCCEEWMKNFEDLCPNFNHLIVWGGYEIPTILPRIFEQWQHLESLELNVNNLNHDEGKSFRLNEAITGTIVRFSGPGGKMTQCQDGPSIRDLTALTFFQILFACPHQNLAQVVRDSITDVSGKEFMKMPNLRVSIAYDHNCRYSKEIDQCFLSVSPYVNLTSHHNYENDKVTGSSSRTGK